MSADTVSSLYPDRPIRPLPKRRLRERLSPEVADSIQYPPAPQNTTPLFYYPYNTRDDDADPISSHGRERFSDSEISQGRRTVGTESDDDDYGTRRNVLSRPAPGSSGSHQRLPPKPAHGRHPNSQPPLSAGSSADGYYDPFEITNNKKKRKIPSAGDSALNGSHSLHDGVLGSEPPSTPVQSIEGHGDTSPATSTPYYGCGSFASGGQNVSGPGRGRYGRVRNGRSPLRALSDSTNNWAGRNGKLRPSQWTSQTSENTGIISNAIANAEKLTSHQGQENISLLQQQQSAKGSPASTQFTFTCDSQVPGTVSWPGSDRHGAMSMPIHNVQRGEGSRKTSQATQASNTTSAAPNGHAADMAGPSKPTKGGHNQPKPPQKKSRKRAERELLLAAKARRRQTENQNFHNPPRPEDIWICEFCEYEAIFGSPPAALVRQYEIKDRKLRQQEEERRRLLEKAKMRSRKGKKGSKAASKGNNLTQDRNQPHGGNQATQMHGTNSQETHSEEYDDEDEFDEEEEEYGPREQPPPLEDDPAAKEGGKFAGVQFEPGPAPAPGPAREPAPTPSPGPRREGCRVDD